MVLRLPRGTASARQRLWATLLIPTAALALATTARPAAADINDAHKFLDAVADGDIATACDLLSSELRARLADGERPCELLFDGELRAKESLQTAWYAARSGALKRDGRFTTQSFTLRKLRKEMLKDFPIPRIVLGRGPKEAANTASTTVVLDTRSTAARLILFARSDTGTVWRLSAASSGAPPEIVKVGVFGRRKVMTYHVLRFVETSDGKFFAKALLVYPNAEPAALLFVLDPASTPSITELYVPVSGKPSP